MIEIIFVDIASKQVVYAITDIERIIQLTSGYIEYVKSNGLTHMANFRETETLEIRRIPG